MNLLIETLDMLKKHNKTPSDVNYVLIPADDGWKVKPIKPDGWITWEQFESIANVEYDNGFGGQEINPNMMIVGDNWWIERHEYDGSEWWELKTHPKIEAGWNQIKEPTFEEHLKHD